MMPSFTKSLLKPKLNRNKTSLIVRSSKNMKGFSNLGQGCQDTDVLLDYLFTLF